MKKAIIYYYTGTGNTRIAATEIKRCLDGKGYATNLYEIRKPGRAVPDPNDYDVVGFGYPIHAFNAPQLFHLTIKHLPNVDCGKPAFIFKTSGEPFWLNNASSASIIRFLKWKGFSVLMDRHLLMPYNILFRYDDALAKQMFIHTRMMAAVIVHDILDNKTTKRTIYPWTWLVMRLLRIQWYGARINGPLFHARKDKCRQCGLCSKMCPSDNIVYINGYPKFSFDCSMCMGCVAYCPADAIRPGLINPLRVHGGYPFTRLLADDSLASDFINENTNGYFRSFRNYYRKTYAEIERVRSQERDMLISPEETAQSQFNPVEFGCDMPAFEESP